MSQTSRQTASPFDMLTTYVPTNTTDVPAELGTTAATPDGRTFKLGFIGAGSTTLNPGKLTQGPAVVSALQGATASAQSIGDTTLTLTFSSSSFAANVFAGGFLGVILGTGSVQTLQIKSHPAVASATSCVFTLVDPVYVTTSLGASVNTWAHPYSRVSVSPTTITGTLTGIPLVTVTADATYGAYAWFQTGGLCVALNQGGTTAGLDLAPSATVVGALATAAATTNHMATASQAGTDTAYGFVDLKIFS